MKEIQTIGADIGRGYVKGYTEVEGIIKTCMFKSVVALGRNLEFENYENPIFIDLDIDGKNYNNIFCGVIAQKEGFAPIKNSMDSKITDTVKKLLGALIMELAEKNIINIMIGVPNREWNKKNLKLIQDAYKNKTIKVRDKINNKTKEIKINDINIFKESDAALLYHINQNKPNNTNDNVMVNVGFRTTEISFYDNNLRYVDKKSMSFELGNQTVLEYVQQYHKKRSLEEIDTSSRYDEMKDEGYKMLTENIEQSVEAFLVNLEEINLYACGGVVSKLDLTDKFIKTEDPQMLTAKGLFFIGCKKFK